MGIRKAGYGVIGVGVAIVATWASVAFACTVQPQVSYSLLPESASPGTTVVVRGESIATRSPVEIRWNGVGGRVLAEATADNGAFSVPVEIPQAAPGIYSLTIVTADGGVGRTALEVMGEEPSSPAPALQVWPSLATTPDVAAPDSRVPGAIGMALLAVGLVGLVAGSAFAVIRRRPAPATIQR